MEIRKEYGYIKGHVEENEMILDILYVDKGHRGKGHAKELVNEFVENARKIEGLTEIGLYAEPQSDDGLSEDLLIQFYVDCGFESHGDCDNLMVRYI